MYSEVGSAAPTTDAGRDEVREVAGEGMPLAVRPSVSALNHECGKADHVVRRRITGSRAADDRWRSNGHAVVDRDQQLRPGGNHVVDALLDPVLRAVVLDVPLVDIDRAGKAVRHEEVHFAGR